MKKLIIVILLSLMLVGCGTKYYKANKNENPIDNRISYEDSLTSSEFTKLREEVVNNGVSINYKSYYYYEKNKELADTYAFSKQFVDIYEKLNYSELSEIERDVLDYMFYFVFWNDVDKDINIEKIWLIGYDETAGTETNTYKNTKNYKGIFIKLNYIPSYNNFLGFKYEHEDTTTVMGFGLYYDNSLPIDVTKEDVFNDPRANLIIAALNGKHYKLLDEETTSSIDKKYEEILKFLTKYNKDYQTEKVKSYRCNNSSSATQAAKNDTWSLSSVKSRFHKIINCDTTNTRTEDNGDKYIVYISGTCSGYTDIYDDDFNIGKFDYKVYVDKETCKTSSSVSVDMKY